MRSPSPEVYDSNRRRHPIVEEMAALIRYKELVRQSVARAIKTRYKRSALGVVWTMLNPLLTTLVLTLVFSTYFRGTIANFPIYVLSGLTAWNFFSSVTHAAMSDMLMSGMLLGRIYMPKSIFAVSATGVGLVNLAISFGVLLVISLILGSGLHWSLLVTPLAALLLAVFSLGLGLLLATAAVYFADMLPVYDVLLLIWMYATPIIYSIDIIPTPIRSIFLLNPMYYFVEIFRAPIHSGTVPPWDVWAIAAAWAAGMFLLGAWVFTSRSNDYAYRI